MKGQSFAQRELPNQSVRACRPLANHLRLRCTVYVSPEKKVVDHQGMSLHDTHRRYDRVQRLQVRVHYRTQHVAVIRKLGTG